MAQTINRLSDKTVASKRTSIGMHADGAGLYLRVAENSRQWIFRYVTNGRMRDMGLGPTHTLSLAEAREKARDARKLRLDGIDPIEHKRAQRAAAVAAEAKQKTFRDCALGFIKDNEKKWTNREHREQWSKTLESYVYPELGNLPVDMIDTPMVLKVIKPLWERIPETAQRVRGRIENILGWATVHHYRSGDNPAAWSGLIEHALPARKDTEETVEHHAALPYDQAPAFMAAVRADTSRAARCLEFMALTAMRLGAARFAKWSEVDEQARVWTVPRERMMKSHKRKKKGGKDGDGFRVPLSTAAVGVLKAMREIRQSDYIFPGDRKASQPIGRNMPNRIAKRLAPGVDITAHGLRSTFKDWASECTSFPNEVSEAALAHTIKDETEAAYRRGELFEKRRRLMEAWAQYCAKPAARTGDVVPIRR